MLIPLQQGWNLETYLVQAARHSRLYCMTPLMHGVRNRKPTETEGRWAFAGVAGGGKRAREWWLNGYKVSLFGVIKCSKISSSDGWLHNSGTISKTIGWFSSKGWILWYGSYISTMLQKLYKWKPETFQMFTNGVDKQYIHTVECYVSIKRMYYRDGKSIYMNESQKQVE